MKKDFINKHYKMSIDLLKKLEEKKPNHIKYEIDCIEYFLEKGMLYEEYHNELKNINENIKLLKKENMYIKRIIEQLFSNIAFTENVDIRKNDLLKEFKNNIYKDKYFD